MIRRYVKSDKEQLLSILRLNTPKYFDPSEEPDLIEYLDHEIEYYVVFEEEGKVLGGGGYNILEEESEGRISWDFVHPDAQGRGIGTALLKHRLEKLEESTSINSIIVRTSQMAHEFYAKHGFEVLVTQKDYWAAGFDLVIMEYDF